MSASSDGSRTFHSYRPCSPTGTPLCRVVTCAVVVDGNCVVSGTTASKRAQQRVVAVAGEEAPAEGVEQDEDDVPSARGQAVERRRRPRPTPSRRATVSGSAAKPPSS